MKMQRRAMAFLISFLTLLVSGTVAQPVTVEIGVLGGAVPFGEAYSGVGFGGAAEVSSRYHLGSLALGLGVRVTDHGDTEVGRDFRVGTVFAEARYGERFTSESLDAGDRFYPYAGLRLGYVQRERRVSDFLILTADGPELQPRAGFELWLSRDLAVDASLGLQLAEFNGSFGGAGVMQTSLVIGL